MVFFINSFLLILVALFSTLFVYPLLHELGHFIMAVLLGYDILSFDFYGGFRMMLSVENCTVGVMLVSFAGIIFPLLCVMLLPSDCFIFRMIKIDIFMMNGMVTICSAVCVIMHTCGIEVNDDIANLTAFYPQTVYVNFMIIVIIELVTIIYIKNQKFLVYTRDFLFKKHPFI